MSHDGRQLINNVSVIDLGYVELKPNPGPELVQHRPGLAARRLRVRQQRGQRQHDDEHRCHEEVGPADPEPRADQQSDEQRREDL